MAKFFDDPNVAEFTGVFRGDGVNHDKQSVQAQWTGEPILSGQAFRIHLVAHNVEGSVLHEEETIISPDGPGGTLKMFNFNSNSVLTVMEHCRQPDGANADNSTIWQFSTNNLEDPNAFRMRVTLKRAGGKGAIEYTYEWAMPGGNFKPRSSLVLKRC